MCIHLHYRYQILSVLPNKGTLCIWQVQIWKRVGVGIKTKCMYETVMTYNCSMEWYHTYPIENASVMIGL